MCSKYGIPKYEPHLFESRREFLEAYRDDLLNLIGKTIDGYLLFYDERDNEWNKDAPAILIIDGRHYEFTAFQIDYFNMTIDAVDLNILTDWYAREVAEKFVWKKNYINWVNRVIGRRILGINLLGTQFEPISITNEFPNRRDYEDRALNGIEFMLDKATDSGKYTFFQVYNDTDEIGIEVINESNY